MKFILPINVKIPTNVGILLFISRINTTSEKSQARKIFSAFMYASDKTSNYMHVYIYKCLDCFKRNQDALSCKNKSADQPLHQRSLISCIDSAIAYIQSLVCSKTSKSGGLTSNLMFCNETNESVQIS